MAKAKKKAIPRQRGTKKASPAPKAPRPAQVIEPQQITTPPHGRTAQLVDPTPENRQLAGYREQQVIATRSGHFGLKQRSPEEVFTVGVVGEGELPDWVRPAS